MIATAKRLLRSARQARVIALRDRLKRIVAVTIDREADGYQTRTGNPIRAQYLRNVLLPKLVTAIDDDAKDKTQS